MNITVIVVCGVIIGFILLGIIKKVVKAIIGLVLIIALILGGLYIYNTYPSQVKDISSTIKQVVNSTTTKDYLRADTSGKYYVFVATKTSSGNYSKPTGKIFDYPGVDIGLDKIINIASGDFKNLKKQYYKIDKEGNPIVPTGITPPRKFLQPKLTN